MPRTRSRRDEETFDEALAQLVALFKARGRAHPGGAPSTVSDAAVVALTLGFTGAASYAAWRLLADAHLVFFAAAVLFFTADLHSGLVHVVLDDPRACRLESITHHAS